MSSLRFVLLCCALALSVTVSPPVARAFKIGYRGIKVLTVGVDDFPPVHEAVTAEAVRHFCHAEGLEKLQSSRLYTALFTQSLASCDAVLFGTDMAN